MEIFGIIVKDNSPITSSRIVQKFWRAKRNKPFNYHAALMVGLRSLIKKVNYNHEGFVIKTGPKSGHGIVVWIEQRG
jgi:hypothetical protein